MIDLHVGETGPGPGAAEAADIVAVIHAAFRARPRLDPPGTALEETTETVEAALRKHGGLLARVDGEPAGAMLFCEVTTEGVCGEGGSWLGLRRVSVHPHHQRRGVATAMVGCAEEVAAARGYVGVRLQARMELPETMEFWRRRGYVEVDRADPDLFFGKALPMEFEIATPEAMTELGASLAPLLRAGDLVVLAGELGAGKTTLTQGLGAQLGVRGDIASPTFVISRVHPSRVDGPALVHVDAYRLGGGAELDDLDLDTEITEAVTVVEWGHGIAESLAEDRLEVSLTRAVGGEETMGFGDGSGPDADPRHVRLVPIGRRWTNGALHAALARAVSRDYR